MDNLAGSIGLLLYQSICHHERIEEIAKNKYFKFIFLIFNFRM